MKNRKNPRQNALNNAINPLVELLESRQLLSSSLDTVTKELTITGTADADDITVLRVGSDYKLGFNGDLEIYAVSEISSIKINSLAGDDHIAMNSAIYCPVTIDAGDGLVESNILNLIGATGAEAFSILKPDISQSETTDHFSTSYNTHSYSHIEKINVDTRGGWDTATITSSIPVSFTATQYFESLSISADARVEVATGVNDLILSGPAKMIRVHSLSITGNAVFNLNDNILVIDYQDGPSPYGDVRNYITNGLGILGATGSGIDSNSVNVQATPGTMISLVDNGAIDGAINHVGSFNNIPFHSVLVTYTWFGDANLDGVVNGTDAALIDTGFIAGNVHEWIYGDIDYSNQVDNGDLGLYDTGFIAQSGAAIGIYKPAPTTVRAQKLWDSAIRVSWEAPPTSVQEYLIWASIDGGEYKLVAQPAATDNYFDYHFTEPHAASVSFRVSVRSENVVSKVVYALDVTNPDIDNPVVIDQTPGTDPPPDYADPGVPVNKEPVSPTALTAKAIENNGLITLHWSDNSDNETGFIIYRSEDGQNFTELTRVGKDVTSYDDASVERGLRYYYKVAAYNDVGISDTTGPENAILKLQKPTGLQAVAPNDSEANLSWQDTSKHETGFLIQYKDTTVGGTYGNDLSVPVNATGWTIVGLISKHTYDFRIKAIGEAESDWFEKASATTTKSRFLNGGLYNTGVDNDNHALAGGVVDPHYGGYVTFNNPGAWTGGSWIGPVADQNESYAPTSGTYELHIDLTEMGVPPGGLSGSWTTDNSGQMKVNGVIPQKEGHNDPAFSTPYEGFGELHAFTIPANLLNAGTNTISFSFDSSSGDPNWGGAAGIVVVWDNMEDPGLSKVSITATDPEATEGKDDDFATYRIRRVGGDQSEPLQVQIHIPAGTATNNTDYKVIVGENTEYEPMPASVTIPDGEEYVDIKLKALKDDKIEGDETAILCLKADAAYRLATAYSATVTIKDGPSIDIDVDSDNTLRLDKSQHEDDVEDTKAGVVVIVNHDDDDKDKILDFADGFGQFDDTAATKGEDDLVPVQLRLSKLSGADLSNAKIIFDYDAALLSDSATRDTIQKDGLDGQTYYTYRYSSGNGSLRLWKSTASNASRTAADFIEPDIEYSLSDLGISSDSPISLQLEAVNGKATHNTIKVVVKLSASESVEDKVRVLPLDPVIDITESEIEGINIVRAGSSFYTEGTSGRDLIIGKSGNEQIFAGAGDDIIIPKAGNDTINAGSGDDVVFSWSGSKDVTGVNFREMLYIEGSTDGHERLSNQTATQPFKDTLSNSSASSMAVDEKKEAFSAEDIIKAYEWAYGDNDLWYQAFKRDGGEILTVDDNAWTTSAWDVDFVRLENTLASKVKYVAKIEYGIGSVLDAANALRKCVLYVASSGRKNNSYNDYIQDVWSDFNVKPKEWGEKYESWQQMRESQMADVAATAELVAGLYYNGMASVAGIGADLADVVINFKDYAKLTADVATGVFNMMIALPGKITEWVKDEESVLAGKLLEELISVASASGSPTSPEVLSYIVSAAAKPGAAARAFLKLGEFGEFRQVRDVVKAMVGGVEKGVGFVLRKDAAFKIEWHTLAGGRKVPIIGTAQVTTGANGLEHAATIEHWAGKIIDDSVATRDYLYVGLNRSARTMFDKGDKIERTLSKALVEVNWRPDILAAYIEKGTGKLKFEIFEVPSGSQTLEEMAEKLVKIREKIVAAFPGSMDPIVDTTHVKLLGSR